MTKLYEAKIRGGHLIFDGETGEITELQTDLGTHRFGLPHPSWKVTGCAELRPFGRLRFHSLRFLLDLAEGKDERGDAYARFHFKNGTCRYWLTDLDHGTHRVWSGGGDPGIVSAWPVETR